MAGFETVQDLSDHELSLRKLLLSGACNTPLVFHGFTSDWPAQEWTLTHLANRLGEKKVKCRIGLKNVRAVQWEIECDYLDVTLHEFIAWLQGDVLPSNPLHGYDREKYSCYIDYKYMKGVFSGQPEMLKAVQWESFGFEGRDGTDSTLWIGSSGAYTVGHYDTYGCNLVAQIKGKKRWVLFPPNQTDKLYPTRIPYEESSVFSQINATYPDLDTFPKFKSSTPYLVTLEPGQVLYVPRHWWHFVHCMELSISINTWIELESDDLERVKEAVTGTVVSSLMTSACNDGELDEEDWLNPTQTVSTHTENLELLENALAQVSFKMKTTCDTTEETGPGSAKCLKLDTSIVDQSRSSEIPDYSSLLKGLVLKPGQSVNIVTPSSFSQYLHVMGLTDGEPEASSGAAYPARRQGSDMLSSDESSSRLDPSQLPTPKLVNCLTHPSVVSLVTSLLMQNIK